jgi:hypothetical protein
VKPFHFSEPAAEELTEAVRWYEHRRPGWGGKLFDAVTKTIERIQRHPEIVATAAMINTRRIPILVCIDASLATRRRFFSRCDYS